MKHHRCRALPVAIAVCAVVACEPPPPPITDLVAVAVVAEAAGPVLVLDVEANCPVASISLVTLDDAVAAAIQPAVEVEGLGSTVVTVRIDVTDRRVMSAVLARRADHEIVTRLTLRGACIDGDPVTVAVGSQPFFPTNSVRTVSRFSVSGQSASIRIVDFDDGATLISEIGQVTLLRADGSVARRDDVAGYAVLDLAPLDSTYDVGRYFISPGADTQFFDEDLNDAIGADSPFTNRIADDGFVDDGLLYRRIQFRRTGGGGFVGFEIHEPDGTTRNGTIEAEPRGMSDVYSGTRLLALAHVDNADHLVEFDLEGGDDNGVVAITPFATPSTWTNFRTPVSIFIDGAGRFLVSNVAGELYDLGAVVTPGEPTTFSETPTQLTTSLLGDFRFQREQRRFLLATIDGVYAIEDDAFVRITPRLPTASFTTVDGGDGAFMVRVAGDRQLLCAPDGTPVALLPLALAELQDEASFTTMALRADDDTAYAVHDLRGVVERLSSVPPLP